MSERIDIELSGPQFDIFRSQQPRNLYHAGQGGGKTFSMGFISYMMVLLCPDADPGLIAANTYGQLSDSTLMEITKVWESFGWTQWTKASPEGFYIIDKAPPKSFRPHRFVFKSNQNKIFFRNGAVVMLASLDNYKSIEGRTIAWALLDETSDTKEVAVKEVITGRLRGSGIHTNTGDSRMTHPFVPPHHQDAGEQTNPLYIFTKPAKEQWLTEMFRLEEYRREIQEHIFSETDYFFKEFDNKCVVIASAYHNTHLERSYIDNRLKELSRDQAEMLIYGSPFGKSGAEYYANFDRRIHMGAYTYQSGYPIHFTLDFNVNPYMPAQVWQIVPGKNGRQEVRCIREYALTAPRNTIEHCCQRLIAEFGHLMDAGLFYYGDATGKARMPVKDTRDFYKIVERELREYIYPNSRRLLRQNPRHRSLGHGTLGRREFMNAVLAGSYNVDVRVDESCKLTIADFEFCKEDANGAKLKKVEEINGVKCQKYGHMSDAADALICWNYGSYSKEKNEVQSTTAA